MSNFELWVYLESRFWCSIGRLLDGVKHLSKVTLKYDLLLQQDGGQFLRIYIG